MLIVNPESYLTPDSELEALANRTRGRYALVGQHPTYQLVL